MRRLGNGPNQTFILIDPQCIISERVLRFFTNYEPVPVRLWQGAMSVRNTCLGSGARGRAQKGLKACSEPRSIELEN